MKNYSVSFQNLLFYYFLYIVNFFLDEASLFRWAVIRKYWNSIQSILFSVWESLPTQFHRDIIFLLYRNRYDIHLIKIYSLGYQNVIVVCTLNKKRQLKPGFKIFIFFTRKSGFTEIISFVFPLQESPFSSLDVTSTHETGIAYIVIMRNEKENVESWSWCAAASLVVNLLQCQRRCYGLIWRTIFS